MLFNSIDFLFFSYSNNNVFYCTKEVKKAMAVGS